MKKTTIIYTIESFGEKLRKIDETLLKNIIVILISLLAISCTNSRNRPFPKDDHENEAPVSRPLKFSEAQPLNYKIISKDSIRPPRSVHFDIDKLPTKPFAINDFKILSHPAQTKKLDWDNIPDSLINLDTIAAKPFLMTQTITVQMTEQEQDLITDEVTVLLSMGIEFGTVGFTGEPVEVKYAGCGKVLLSR